MKTLNKIVITHMDNEIIAPATVMAFYKDDVITDFSCYYDDEESLVGNIYLGYVKDIAKNINAAFIEIADGIKGYLPLEESKYAIFANNKNTDKLCQGDKVIVQVAKDAIKTKDCVLTTKFSLAGRYACLTHGDTRLSISKKIKDEAFEESVKCIFNDLDFNDFGLILRTNSHNASLDKIKAEINLLMDKYNEIVKFGIARQGKTCLYNKESAVINTLRDRIQNEEYSIITDVKEIYNSLGCMFSSYNLKPEIKLYEDEYELYKLYSLNSFIQGIASKKVWLKSGGYLIIEATEALTSIDVNTGKYDKGSNKEAAILKINKEAAEEIARQLRFRNISGIIIVDFINMTSPDSMSELISFTKAKLKEDFTPANFVDVTKLGLMEITRKKVTQSFVLKQGDQK